MSIVSEYQDQLREAARGALREAVRQHPSTSVGELRALVAENPGLGSITLTELVGGSNPPVRVRGKVLKVFGSLRADRDAPAAKPKSDEWETRTQAGRDALDRAVLEALAAFGGISVSAEAIRARIGATAAQIRTALNRQIANGEVSFSGQARGTRYSLEG